MAVDQSVGNEEHTLLGVDEVHRSEVVIALADANHFLGHLNGVGIFRVKTGDESVGIARLHHHHAEVVALVHLVDGFLQRVALALLLLRQDFGIALTALRLTVVAKIEHLNTVEVEFHVFGHLANLHVVA